MSGRGHRRNHRRGCERGKRYSFFFDRRRSSFSEGRKREILPVNPPTPSSNKAMHYDNEIFQKIEDYFDEAERGEPVQAGDPP